jgi:hypothetical protein
MSSSIFTFGRGPYTESFIAINYAALGSCPDKRIKLASNLSKSDTTFINCLLLDFLKYSNTNRSRELHLEKKIKIHVTKAYRFLLKLSDEEIDNTSL